MTFEEHYFACDECARRCATGARFRANAREVLEHPDPDFRPREERRPSWWRFPALAPLAACALLVVTVVYQAGVQMPGLQHQIDGLTAARVVPEFIAHEATRGAESLRRIPAGAGPFRLRLDLPPDAGAPTVTCTFADAAGRTIETLSVPVPQGAEPVRVELHHARYPAGRYTITVRTSGGPLAQYAFEVE